MGRVWRNRGSRLLRGKAPETGHYRCRLAAEGQRDYRHRFARGREEPSQPSVLDEAIRRLILDDATTIDEAYQDTVEVVVESDKLERRTDNVFKSFERLLDRVRTSEDREHVIAVGRSLVERLGQLLGLNQA